MRKIIKKFLNGVGWLMLVLILLVFILLLLINAPKIQDLVAKKVAFNIEEAFGSSVSFSKVNLKLLNKVVFEDLLIKDLQEDTIIFAKNLKAGFPGLVRKIIFQKEAPLKVKSLEFDNSYFRIYNDSTNTLNIRFLVDSARSRRDTTGEPKPMYISKIKITNSRFSYSKYDTASRGFGVNFADMELMNFNLSVKNMEVYSDTITMKIKNLDFKEKSGLTIRKMHSDFQLCQNYMHFSKTDIITNESNLNFDKLYFDFNSFNDFGKDIYSDISLNIQSKKSIINTSDLGYFSRFFTDMDQKFILSGNFFGYISDLNVRNLNITYGANTMLRGKFDILGLPDPANTFLVFDIDEFVTTVKDLNTVKLPHNKVIQIPDKLNMISSYKYKGNFTGFFRDFVSYGTLETDLGILETDLLFRPDSTNRITFNGRLSSKKFALGELTSNPDMIGNISLDLSLDGIGRLNKGFDVDIDGNVYQFEVNHYNYRNIEIDGLFSENRFNGKLSIDDPNAKVYFDGLVDLSSSIRKYIFTANVLRANLFNLNINKKDSNYTATFLMNANLSGNQLDDINGEVKLLNSLFAKTDAQIQVYDLDLSIRNDSLLNQLDLESDFLNAKVSGHYKLSQLSNEYLNLLSNYLPAFFAPKEEIKLLSHCDFNYDLHFKNCQPVFQFFIPGYVINPETKIRGELTRNGSLYSRVNVQTPKVKLKNTIIKKAVLNTETINNELYIDFGCENLNLNKRIDFDNLTVETTLDSNFADFDMRWMNWDSALYKGNLTGNIAFYSKPGEKIRSNVEIDSTSIVVNDSVWKIQPFYLRIDSNRIAVNNFTLQHNQEYIYINGSLNDFNKNDSIICRFNSFDFANLNTFTRSNNFRFGGVLDGRAAITGFQKPLFFAELNIKDLELNNEMIGDTEVKSKWNNKTQSVDIDANVYRGKLNTLNVAGNLYPSQNNEMDLKLTFDKFRMDFMNPYLEAVFDDVRGNASGILTLKGTTKEFNLNGDLNIQRVAFTVDYLKTRYHFTTNMAISNNNLIFNNVLLYDEYGNTAEMNGTINTEYFRKYNLGLSIDAKKFQCMNTSVEDNEMLYGTAYASGLIRITGEPESLKFNVTAQTDPGTQINIPLSDNEELYEYNFIRYVDSDTAKTQKESEDYNVNLSGMQMDFRLIVTPEAKVKLIFDPTIGDEIQAQGNGDLRIVINTLGDFKIIGEYIIEQGDYLFTLQDVLNKRFKVEQGSSLRWSGDPVNADINIDTYYRTKASLTGLDDSQQESGGNNVTVDCNLKLTGKLMEPEVSYDISLPFASQSDKDKLNSRINTDEEKGKQFLSLLVLNKFLYLSGQQNNGIGTGDIAGVNASELLSNQLSNWLSQLSNDFDLGVNYRPGSELSSTEVEVILNTQLINDRLSINGSVDMKTNAAAENASKVVGDVDIDYKITKNGRLRARVFNRGNENDLTRVENFSPYTQGVGVFYTEEFDKFSEVTKRYFNALFNREEKKKKKEENQDNSNQALKEEEE